MSAVRLSNGYVATKVDIILGFNDYLGEPRKVSRWCVKHDGSVTHFRNIKELEKGTYSLRKYGFVKTVEPTPEMRSSKLTRGKLSIGLWEAVVGLVNLMDAKGMIDAKENVPQYVRDLGFQRPAVC